MMPYDRDTEDLTLQLYLLPARRRALHRSAPALMELLMGVPEPTSHPLPTAGAAAPLPAGVA